MLFKELITISLVSAFYLMDWGVFLDSVKPAVSVLDMVIIFIDCVAFLSLSLLSRLNFRDLAVPLLLFLFVITGAVAGIADFDAYVRSALRLVFYAISLYLCFVFFRESRSPSVKSYVRYIRLIVYWGGVTGLLSMIQYGWYSISGSQLNLNPFIEQRYAAEGFGFRSPGLSGEPSYNGFLLSISMVYLFAGVHEFGKKISLILFLLIAGGLVSTLSTGTFICLFVVFLYWFLRRSATSDGKKKRRSTLTAVTGAVLVVVLAVAAYLLMERLSSEDVSLTSFSPNDFRYTSSISTRMVAFYAAIVTLSNSPLFGFGINQNEQILPLIGLDSYNYTGSAFLGVIFAYTGIVGSIVFFYAVYRVRFHYLKHAGMLEDIAFFLLITFFLINMSSIFSSDFWGFLIVLINGSFLRFKSRVHVKMVRASNA